MTTIALPPDTQAAAPALEVARALADPLRWRIVALLAGEQLCVAHLTEELGVGQPLVSHHLKALRTAGLVSTERYRYWTYYRLHPDALRLLADHLDGLARTTPNGTACRRAVDGQAPPPYLEEAGPCRSATPRWTRSPARPSPARSSRWPRSSAASTRWRPSNAT